MQVIEESKTRKEEKKIAGALFDFLGYLTRLDKSVTFGSKYEVPIALDILEKWAEKTHLNLNDADVQNWDK